MAKTPSKMVELGTKAPNFNLINVISNQNIELYRASKESRATVIMFICNHCPFVKAINQEIVRLAHDYLPKNITFFAINSNDILNYPDDSPEKMIETAAEHQYPFPYLFDETQLVAKAYQAACTPDFYLFDNDLSLIYRGQLDDSRPNNGIEVTGHSLREALDCYLSSKPVPMLQKPSIGCGIKWKEQ